LTKVLASKIIIAVQLTNIMNLIAGFARE